jgi:xylan 1,4-beta-xylosidase
VSNKGSIAFEYSTMLFPDTSNAGPAPYPNKWLVGFDRLLSITPASSSTLTIPVPIGAISRVDSLGNGVLYPSQYELALNNERSAVLSFTLISNATMLAKWPLDKRQIFPYSVRA